MTCKHILLVKFLNESKLIPLNTIKWFQVLLCIIKNSINHQSNVSTQLSSQTVLFQTIQISTSHLFAQSLNVKQFYLTDRKDPARCCHSGQRWIWERWQRRVTLHSPKFQCWSLAIRLLSVKNRKLVDGGSWPSVEMLGLCPTSEAGTNLSYLPTTPLGQDMTQGQFLSGV